MDHISSPTTTENEKSRISEEPMMIDDEFEPLSAHVDALRLMKRAVSYSRAILVQGPVGCGKSFVIQHLAQQNGKIEASEFITVQLGEHMDGKALLGGYQCTEIPGEFTWIPGPLTKALCEGEWLLLEDLNCAPADALSSLISVLECRQIQIPGRGSMKAHPYFRLFATLREEGGLYRDDRQFIYNQNWVTVNLSPLGPEEAKRIISRRYPGMETAISQLLESFPEFLSGTNSRRMRAISLRDILKLCNRISRSIGLRNDDGSINPVGVFREAADCLCSHIRKSEERLDAFVTLAGKLNVNKETAHYYFQLDYPSLNIDRTELAVGRIKLNCKKSTQQRFRCVSLALTRPTRQLLEKLGVCVDTAEPVLLVGETGCGKTAAVQFLAHHTGTKLHVVNMSQQSENADLTGGFKPTDTKNLVKSLKERFVKLFLRTYSVMKNEKFLRDIERCFNSKQWDVLMEVMRIPSSKGAKSKDTSLSMEWLEFRGDFEKVELVLKNADDGLAFNFVEGVLMKAARNGDWILLDEINLASPEAIDCLYSLLDGQSRNLVAIDQKSSSDPLRIHPNFRLFACMNPSGDVGKKELPTGIRNRFTEIFAFEPESVTDLQEIVNFYLNGLSMEPQMVAKIVELYLVLKKPDPTASSWPSYSLRTLCRSLSYAQSNPYGNIKRSIYEAFCLSFLTELDNVSYGKVEDQIKKHIFGKDPQVVSRSLAQSVPAPANGDFVKVQGYWLKRGPLEPNVEKNYCLTRTVKNNLRDVARAVAARSFPILLQGETSVGKTSLIMYLAKLTGNKCVRINNHEHTDIQEYVGTYTTDENNKLTFVEGPLIKAMRNGEWIILDELNLSPPDILEALNRVLDDNRELFIAETQETIEAHPDFILFATQNPAGIYGGRKMLSRAFRNRFIELRFNELTSTELKDILQHRCSLPASYAQKMVNVMKDLQIHRSKSGVFEGRESFMTLRDLFRWGERYRLASCIPGQLEDWDQYLVDQGYLLLGCRARRDEDETYIRTVLQKNFGRSVAPGKLFARNSPYFPTGLASGHPVYDHMVWTLETIRLAVLVGQALKYNEPVLLVGETGCGKTTICQMLATNEQKILRSINCHMMTEAGDFIGRLCPANADKRKNGILFEWRDGTLVSAMKSGSPILVDEISLADDSVLERLNSVLEPERCLLLAEKGSGGDGTSELVRAADGFALMATMNPGGDYGKKELSRALRNRFTEIWCRSICDGEDIVRIVEHNIRPELCHDGHSEFGRAILRFIVWFSMKCPPEYSRFISLRDVLDWVKFINRCSSQGVPPWTAFLHGAMVTFVDGLGGNKSCTDQSSIEKFRTACIEHLIQNVAFSGLHHGLANEEITHGNGKLTCMESQWGITPFYIKPGTGQIQSNRTYSFETPMCRKNLFRLLRAMQLEKPILLEGAPGVGKTSLVNALAKATGHRLTRINLSEQTDLSELFGCELPIVNADGQQAFDWIDGSFLSALKAGHWILIDEMNLASQSVLEGLNACFDHRGEIYIPELDRSFKVDQKSTRFFACQNPYSQGGNRKGLPKSFLNRFSTIVMEPLGIKDQEEILSNLFPKIDTNMLRKMIEINEKINESVCIKRNWGQLGSPWEFNLRDLMRWCEMTLEQEEHNPLEFVDLIYSSRFRCGEDRKQVQSICDQILNSNTHFESSLQFTITPDLIQVGNSIVPRHTGGRTNLDNVNGLLLCRSMLNPLRLLMHCVRRRQLAILVGKSATGKSCLVKTLAALCGRQLRTVYLNCDSDSSELLGSFEQTVDDSDVNRIKRHLRNCCRGNKRASELARKFDGTVEYFDQISAALSNSNGDPEALSNIHKLKVEYLEMSQRGKKLRFAWMDSPLVEALKCGDWILMENVNYCSPAVLDRLNALLEPDGELIVTERGFLDGKIPSYKPHEDFRIFFTMDPNYGSISRAMRNRGVEICLLEEESWSRDPVDIAGILTSETGDYSISVAIADEFQKEGGKRENGHDFGIRHLLQKAFERSVLPDQGNIRQFETSNVPVLDLLKDSNFRGHIPITSAVENPIEICVIREAAYLVKISRNVPAADWKRVLVALKYFLSQSTSADHSFRFELADWLHDKNMNSISQLADFLDAFEKDSLSRIFRKSKSFGHDWRWNWDLGRFILDEKTSVYFFNRQFMCVHANWILKENISFAHSESLYSAGKEIAKGTELEHIPAAFGSVVLLFSNLPEYFIRMVDDGARTVELDEQTFSLLLRLDAFANVCCGNKLDMHVDSDRIRLYWIWFYNVLNSLLSKTKKNDQELVQLCSSLNNHWQSDKLDWQIYTAIRHHLTGADYVLKSESESIIESFLARAVGSLNDAVVLSVVFDRDTLKRECIELQELIARSNELELKTMDDRLDRLKFEFCDYTSEMTVFSRWDIQMRKLAMLYDLRRPVDSELEDEIGVIRKCGIILPFRTLMEENSPKMWRPLVRLVDLIEHWLMPIRGDGLDEYCNEIGSIKLRGCHLESLPLESIAISDLLQRNIKSGLVQTSISRVPRFLEEIEKFSAYLWRAGVFVGGLQQQLKNTLSPLLKVICNDLRIAMKPYMDMERFESIFSILHDLDLERNQEMLIFYEKCADLALSLCTLSTPPRNCIDPVVKERTKVEWLEQQIEYVDTELDCLNGQYELLTGHQLITDGRVMIKQAHPCVFELVEMRKKLVSKLESLGGEKQYYRPRVSQFESIRRKMQDFLISSQDIFVTFRFSVHRSNEISNTERNILLAKMQNWLQSSEYFQRDMNQRHSAYPDITLPFCVGLYLLRFVVSQWSMRVWKDNIKTMNSEIPSEVYDMAHEFSWLSAVPSSTSATNFHTLPTEAAFCFINYALSQVQFDQNRRELLYNAFIRLVSAWAEHYDNKRKEQEELTYEYKPRAPLETDQQEKMEIHSMFPIPSEDSDEDPVTPVGTEKKWKLELDETWFSRTAQSLLIGNNGSIYDSDQFWQYYQAYLSILKYYPALLLELDESKTLPVHLLALNCVRGWLSAGERKKTLNVYKEWDLEQSAVFQRLVMEMIGRAKGLLEEWPDNEALTLVVESSHRLLALPASSTIMTLAVALERLLTDCEQWEKVASRDVKLESKLDPLRSLLLTWRKMEIESWERLLDDAESEFDQKGTLSVLHFAIVWQTWFTGDISNEDILKSCSQLLEASPVGEFRRRVECVQCLVDLFGTVGVIPQSKKLTQLKLRNMIGYYWQYTNMILEKIKKQREPIEKELKEFLKIVRFQDLNIWSIRKSAADAHRKLFRLVKQYKEALCTVVTTQLELLSIPSIEIPLIEKNKYPISSNLPSISTDFEHLAKSSSYYDRLSHLITDLHISCRTNEKWIMDGMDGLREMSEDTIALLTKPVPYSGTDEEKTKLFKRTLQIRQKSMASVFGVLKEEGFSYRKGAILDETQLNDACFTLPILDCVFESSLFTNGENWKIVENSYWAGISRKLTFEEIRTKPQEQVEPQTTSRCFGFTQQFTLMMVEMQKKLINGGKYLKDLVSGYEALMTLKEDFNNRGGCLNQIDARKILELVNGWLMELEKNLENTRKIWNCCPDENAVEIPAGLIGNTPMVCKWNSASDEYKGAMGILEQGKRLVENAMEEFRKLMESIGNTMDFVSWSHLENLSKIRDSLAPVHELIQVLLQKCSQDGKDEENFLNTHLLRYKRNIDQILNETLEERIAEITRRQSADDDDDEDNRNRALSTGDTIVKKVLLTTQSVVKSTMDIQENEPVLEKIRRFMGMVTSDTNDGLRSAISEFVDKAAKCSGDSQMADVVTTVTMFVQSHVDLVTMEYHGLLNSAWTFHKFYAVTLECWTKLMKSGYLEPAPIFEKGDDGGGDQIKFEDIEKAGLGDGEGVKDVSDQITDTGQIEELKNQKQTTEDEEKSEQKMDDVEKPIEMDDDFDAAMEDVKEGEDESNGEDGDSEDEQQPDMEWKEDEVEQPQDEQLDPGLWDEKREDQSDQPELDDSTRGANKPEESLVAKENQPENDEYDGDRPNEIENMENQEENVEESDFDLENVNLNDPTDRIDDENENDAEKDENLENEQTGEGEQEEEEEQVGNEEKLEEIAEEEPNEEENENWRTADKTFNADGANLTEEKGGDRGENANENDSSQQQQQQQPGKPDLRDTENQQAGESNLGQSEASRGDQSKMTKRSQMEIEEETNVKRQRVEDSEKTMGSGEETPVNAVDIEQVEEGTADGEMGKESDAYSHGKNVGADGVDVVDSASVETAMKQQLEQRRQLKMKEKEWRKGRNERSEWREDEKTVEMDETKRGQEKEDEEKMDVDEDEMEEEMMKSGRDTKSSIHTVTDFYTHATTVNFEELLKMNIDHRTKSGTDPVSEDTKAVWFKYVSLTERLALELTENLRLALEPTVASKLQGDYRSGKRLNIRKLIPYIASQFRKNKIWLRRTKKAKRDYHILLAIDDSASMKDNLSLELTFGSLALLSTALRYLEVGRFGVCKFGQNPELLHGFDAQFMESSGPHVISRLTFEQQKTNVAALLEFVNAYFAQEASMGSIRNTDALPAQLLLIVSDGRGIFAEGVDRVKAAVQQSLKMNIFTVFLVLDNPTLKHSILDIKSFLPSSDGRCEIRPYMESFPFPFYIIVRDVSALPAVIGDALRQWFEFVVSQH